MRFQGENAVSIFLWHTVGEALVTLQKHDYKIIYKLQHLILI